MVDEVESKLSGEQYGRWPKGCGGRGLANVASREEIIVVAFNFPDAVQVRQACLATVTVATMAYPRCHLVPGTSLTYFQIFELGRTDYVFVVSSLSYFCDSGRCLVS